MLSYVLYNYKIALASFTLGRNIVIYEDKGNFLLNTISGSLGIILPALIAYYFLILKSNKLIVPLIISLPIFILLFLYGTRFPLLFSLLGFGLVVKESFIYDKSIKKYLIIGLVFSVLLGSSLLMREMRSSASKNQVIYAETNDLHKDLPTYISQYMSPEGVVDMTSLMFEHFDSNSFLYGTSSSFIFYFWIPRSIWANKPTMLGHWLIREYRDGFGSVHSSSFGFTGDLYADFGYFSLFFILLFGVLLKHGENFKVRAFKSKDYGVILGAMIYPYVFFFVRSPITSTMNFIGILFFYLLFKRLFFVKV